MAEEETDGKIRLKVVEPGGKSVEIHLVRVNPTGSDDCGGQKCEVCPQPGGGGGGGRARSQKQTQTAESGLTPLLANCAEGGCKSLNCFSQLKIF